MKILMPLCLLRFNERNEKGEKYDEKGEAQCSRDTISSFSKEKLLFQIFITKNCSLNFSKKSKTSKMRTIYKCKTSG